MRFIDSKETDPCSLEHRFRVVERQPVGRDLPEPQASICNRVENGGRFIAAVRRIESACRNPIGLQLRDLIAHQRDQRRDDNGQSVPQKRGQLIAKRLAAARRHNSEHVSPIEDRADNIILARTEICEPKGLPQAFLRCFHIAHAGDLQNLNPPWEGRRNPCVLHLRCGLVNAVPFNDWFGR